MKAAYYILPMIEALKTAEGEEKTLLIRKLALAISDPVALRNVLKLSPEEFANFYPNLSDLTPSTGETIDSFIDNYANNTVDKTTDIDDLMQTAAANTTYDLSSIEADSELEEQRDETFDLLNNFLQDKTPQEEIIVPEEIKPAHVTHSTIPPARSAMLTTAELQKLIKNGDYQRALEIITELNLNNPKKSVYFAEQIRFLKKLIALSAK